MFRKIRLILFVLLTVTGLWIYNLQAASDRLARQREFDEWVEEIRPIISSAKNKFENDAVQLRLEMPKSEGQVAPDLLSSSSHEVTVLRILDLLKEANLFSVRPASGVSASDLFSLSVKTNNQQFTAHFSNQDISNNVRAQNAITLIKLYAQNPVALEKGRHAPTITR